MVTLLSKGTAAQTENARAPQSSGTAMEQTPAGNASVPAQMQINTTGAAQSRVKNVAVKARRNRENPVVYFDIAIGFKCASRKIFLWVIEIES